ncbi:MAG: 50S ribosomal protein L22 [Flavobacteriales bacterium]|nr:50S ribosomal protein L22 [Flavobacteriales bacterium]
MGVRKRNKAEEVKEQKKSLYYAKLNNCPTSPRKMRLVADMVRGKDVYQALSLLEFSSKDAAVRVEKLLKSAIANYESKTDQRADENLFVKEIWVDGGRVLKRISPAPQGRAHRIRKRSNHVTLVLDIRKTEEKTEEKPN